VALVELQWDSQVEADSTQLSAHMSQRLRLLFYSAQTSLKQPEHKTVDFVLVCVTLLGDLSLPEIR